MNKLKSMKMVVWKQGIDAMMRLWARLLLRTRYMRIEKTASIVESSTSTIEAHDSPGEVSISIFSVNSTVVPWKLLN
jgi:hypothetical protein